MWIATSPPGMPAAALPDVSGSDAVDGALLRLVWGPFDPLPLARCQLIQDRLLIAFKVTAKESQYRECVGTGDADGVLAQPVLSLTFLQLANALDSLSSRQIDQLGTLRLRKRGQPIAILV